MLLYYAQSGASSYNLDEALGILLTLTARGKTAYIADGHREFADFNKMLCLASMCAVKMGLFNNQSDNRAVLSDDPPHTQSRALQRSPWKESSLEETKTQSGTEKEPTSSPEEE